MDSGEETAEEGTKVMGTAEVTLLTWCVGKRKETG